VEDGGGSRAVSRQARGVTTVRSFRVKLSPGSALAPELLEAQVLNQQLQHAPNSRIVIEQAKGIVAERAGLDTGQAFTALRTYARDHNLRLVDVAEAAIACGLAPSALVLTPRR
jgi:hypothetical protein